MEMTTYGTERQAAMPMAAPAGAVALGYCLVPKQDPVQGTIAPFGIRRGIAAAVKPWIHGSERQVDASNGLMTTRSTRRLGRTST
jgi:hypothetical protein